MKKQKVAVVYSPGEEKANFWTHLLGVLFGVIGVFLSLKGDPDRGQQFYTIVFFLTCIILYSSSSLYHFATGKKQKLFYKKLDHISIYLLIAGTFTPFCFGVLGDESIGKNLGLAVWGIALLGTIFKIFFTGKYEIVSLISYLGMGWMGFLMFDRLADLTSPSIVNLMLYGGLAYSIGVVFYVMRKLKYHHAIWHLFVLAGTAFHAAAILQVLAATHV